MYKKLLMFSIILSFTLKLEADFVLKDCSEENIFYLVSLTGKKAEFSNFYCDFGKTNLYNLSDFSNIKPGTFVSYDKESKKISKIGNNELLNYVKDLKEDFLEVKKDKELKNKLIDDYLNNFQDYENKFFKIIKSNIFSSYELKDIDEKLSKTPLKIFQNTYSQRLLMGGEIISREEWGAQESYSKKEVYMKGCENGSCFAGGPQARDELKENYLKYFNATDAKNRLVKTFDDGRDTLRYYPVDRIIIHHTGGGYMSTKEEGMSYMRSVQKYHALTLRWGDIGYHYLIDGEGNIYEGKSGGKYVLGSHVATHNYGSIGIALMSDGYYSPEMMASLKKLVIYLGEEYNLDLDKETTVRSNNLTGWTTGWAVLAHKELDSRKPKDPEIDMDNFREDIIAEIKNNKIVSNK